MSGLQQPLSTREEVRSTLEAILAREEFGPRRSWLAERWRELLDWIGDWLSELFGITDPATERSIVIALLSLMAAVILTATVLRIVRWAREREERPAARTVRSSEDRRAESVAALRREARAASARGDRVAALRLLFRALVLGLSERGELEYRDAWTNRELFERGAPRREVAPMLAALVPRLDAQSFGHEPAGPADVDRLDALCDRLLARRHA